MHINMKYYIVSIGAIFIALGIGMLVGFNLNYDQELSEQQANVINDLDKKFETLRETNDSLEESLAELTTNYDQAIAFINENTDKILVDSLLEKNVGIISTNESNDYTEEIANIIAKSNGNLSFSILITKEIENNEKVKEASQVLGVEFKTTQDVVKYVSEAIKLEEGRANLETLQELGLIKINSLSPEYANYNSVVLTGGDENKKQEERFKNVDEVLISALKEDKKNIVAVQKSDVKFSTIDLYSNAKVATIDNINEGIGQITLSILLNKEEATGNFGRLETAENLYPINK